MTTTRRPFSWPAVSSCRRKARNVSPLNISGSLRKRLLPSRTRTAPPVADALAPRVMPHHGISFLPRPPPPTARAMLAEMDLVPKPKVDGWVVPPRLEFFLVGLAPRTGLGDERAAQPVTRVNQAKKTPALAHTHLHLRAFPQTNPEHFSIRPIGVDLGLRRWEAYPAAHFLQWFRRPPGRSSGAMALRPNRRAPGRRTAGPHSPTCAGIARPRGPLFAAHPGSNEPHAVRSVTVASIVLAVDFLL